MLPDGVRRGGVVGRQVLGALAGADNLEPAGARPVDQLHDQGRLIAVGQGIGRCRPRPRGEPAAAPASTSASHVDHDHVPAGGDAGQRVAHTGDRIAGRLDHHLGIAMAEHAVRVREHADRRDLLIAPARPPQRGLRPLRRQIAHAHDPHPRGGAHLRQEHGGELARAD